jgi:molybdopterin molybdotransferase
VPLEDIQLSDDGKNTWVHLSKTWEDADQNIFVTKEGADYKKNAQLLEHGRKIGVAELAVLAACGKNKVAVFKKLKVAVLSTGDELVEPGKSLSLAKIWDSNRPQLLSLLNQMGMETLDLGLIGDDEKKLTQKIKQAMIRCDGLILSGGMSAGDRDFSIPVLKKLGAKIIFDRIALKPGKPSVYAIFKNKTKEKFIFGLPGNPISAYVVFEVLVRDYLKSRQGELGDNKKIFARLEQDMPQHRGPRIFFRPIRVDDGGVAHLPRYHGSSHLHAFTQANALYCQKPNEKSPRAGDFILLEKLL